MTATLFPSSLALRSLLTAALALGASGGLFVLAVNTLPLTIASSLLIISASGALLLFISSAGQQLMPAEQRQPGFVAGTLLATILTLIFTSSLLLPLFGPLGWLAAIIVQPLLAQVLIPRCPKSLALNISVCSFFVLPLLVPLSFYW